MAPVDAEPWRLKKNSYSIFFMFSLATCMRKKKKSPRLTADKPSPLRSYCLASSKSHAGLEQSWTCAGHQTTSAELQIADEAWCLRVDGRFVRCWEGRQSFDEGRVISWQNQPTSTISIYYSAIVRLEGEVEPFLWVGGWLRGRRGLSPWGATSLPSSSTHNRLPQSWWSSTIQND